jgi:hypothetical protein
MLLMGCGMGNRNLSRIANATTIFPLYTLGQEYVLIYKDTDAELALYEVQHGRFIERASVEAPAVAQKAVFLGDHIIVAYGYGRGKLQDPIRIVQYDFSLQNPKELLTQQSERNEVADLIAVPKRNEVFVSFFTSKYMTSAGWLRPSDGAYTEVIATRLGTQYDIEGDTIVQGRPYGDALGEDGDVTLLLGTGSQRLPSFRGVSEVKFAQLDDDPEEEILIADGWHQNYGQLAEPRVSLLDKKNGAYTLETLAILRPQYTISTIHPFMVGQKHYLFVAGNSSADILDLSNRSVRNLYTSSDLFFNAALVGQRGNTIDVAIKEQKDAWLTSVDL